MPGRSRPCLDCGTLTRNGSRCLTCAQRVEAARDNRKGDRYGSAWRRHSQQQRRTHRDTYGDWCPGWGVPGHPSTDLVTDHDLGVMCRACNSRKAAVHDRPRRHPPRHD